MLAVAPAPVPALAAPAPVPAEIPVALLVDLSTGQHLYAREIDRRFMPASVTKVMTAYTAFRLIDEGRVNPSTPVLISQELEDQWSGEGSTMFLKAGERPTFGELLLGATTTHGINPVLQKLPYDANKDLIPVTQVGVTPMLMTVPKASPYATAADLMKAAKAAPGKLTFGSGGQGTVQYMAPELMNQSAGVSMLHIPYKSGGLAITATLASEVDMGFFNLPAISGHVKSGLVKALAITSAQRNPLFPDVPTIAESGLPSYESTGWHGWLAPSGTPKEHIALLNAAVPPDKIFLLNPDARLGNDTVTLLADFLDHHPQAGALALGVAFWPSPKLLVPAIRLRARDIFGQIQPHQLFPSPRFGDQPCNVKVALRVVC